MSRKKIKSKFSTKWFWRFYFHSKFNGMASVTQKWQFENSHSMSFMCFFLYAKILILYKCENAKTIRGKFPSLSQKICSLLTLKLNSNRQQILEYLEVDLNSVYDQHATGNECWSVIIYWCLMWQESLTKCNAIF